MATSISTIEPLRLEGKARLAVACGLSGALFWVLGGLVLGTTDPLAPATMLGRSNVLALWATLGALVGVSAAIGASLMGRWPLAGVMTAGVGLAVLALRFGSIENLLLVVGADAAARKTAFSGLLVETLLWAALMALAVVVEAGVRRWLRSSAEAHAPAAGNWAAGLLAVGVVSAVAVLIISQFVARDATALVHRKQVFFAVFLAFFLGSLAAYKLMPAAGDRWPLLAPPAVAVLGYLWAWWEPLLRGHTYYDAIPHLPPNWLVRALPIEYLGVGVSACVLGLWIARSATETATETEAS